MNLLKYPVLRSLVVLILVVITQTVQAQTGIKGIIASIDTFNYRLPVEKLYLQFDKPYYAVGDTIWFKAYLLNSNLSYSPLSSRLYVEVLNDSSKVIRRIAVPMGLGIAWGNIALDGVREGSISIRTYTNWMRNFGDDYFFSRAFYVANPQRQTWLVNAGSQLADANDIKMAVKFTSLDQQTANSKPMDLRVTEGKKTLFKGTGQTDANGRLDVNFPLPEKTAVKNLVLVVQDKADKKKQVTIPVNTHRAKDVDVQFMPESGYMVAGLPSHIGFKVIGDDGRGINVSGKIVKAGGEEVCSFESMYKGMGTFDLAPQNGDVYTAKISLPDGQIKDVALPAIKASGTEVRIRNLTELDSLEVSVFISADLVNPANTYYLIGQSSGAVCFGATISASKAFTKLRLAKSLFPTGIVHISLLNAQNQPLNERLTFVDHHDNLKVNITPGRQNFSPRDSIPLKITVNYQSGKPVVGSFSMAVTDDNQVKVDSTTADNIATRFLLSSDLKGYIEGPAYYLNASKPAWQALDALLLTQGWISYNWANINTVNKPVFQPEYQYTVNGHVGNLFNKPIAKAEVTLLAKGRYNYVMDTLTNAQGRFTFTNFPPIDSVTFVLEAHNSRHKVINAGITVEENQPAEINKATTPHAAPWYINSDAAMLNFVKTNPAYHSEFDKAQFGPQGRLLKQVTVRNTAIIKGSANLNGAGEADQVIDEETIVNADKTSLYDLLEQKVAGYHVSFVGKPAQLNYLIKDKKVRFVFDGVDLNRFYEPLGEGLNEYYNYIKQYLDYFTAEDIKGIEVAYSLKNTSAYGTRNLTTDELLAENPAGGRGSSTAYLEITTRAGNGPFTRTANGIYVYKPLKNTLPKTFYRPRYPVKDVPVKYADLRSTIHWDPTVVTNKSGEADISFYAADKPGTYTIILEGADLNGKIGYQTQKVIVSTGAR